MSLPPPPSGHPGPRRPAAPRQAAPTPKSGASPTPSRADGISTATSQALTDAPKPYRFDPETLRRWRNPAVFVVAVAVLLARRVSLLLRPVFVLEDGPIFFGEQIIEGFRPFEIFNGGIYVGQRAVSLLTSVLPLPLQPRSYYLAACLLAVLPLMFLLGERCGPLLGPWRWRAALVLVLVVAPSTASIQGTLAYLHWWWIVPALVIVASRPTTRRWSNVAEFAFLLVMGLSGFGALFVIPTALWGCFRFRERVAFVRLGIVVVSSAIAVWVLVASGRDNGPRQLSDLVTTAPYIVNRLVGAATVLGQETVVSHWSSDARPYFIVVGILFLATSVVVAATDWRGPSPWWLLGASVLAGAAFFSVSWVEIEASQMGFPYQERYFAGVTLVLLLILFRAAATSPLAAARTAASVALVACAIGVVNDVKLPQWEAQPGSVTIEDLQRCLAEKQQDVCELSGFPADWRIWIDVDR